MKRGGPPRRPEPRTVHPRDVEAEVIMPDPDRTRLWDPRDPQSRTVPERITESARQWRIDNGRPS